MSLLKKLQELNNPKTLKDLFLRNDEDFILKRYDAPLKEIARKIKEGIIQDFPIMLSQIVQKKLNKAILDLENRLVKKILREVGIGIQKLAQKLSLKLETDLKKTANEIAGEVEKRMAGKIQSEMELGIKKSSSEIETGITKTHFQMFSEKISKIKDELKREIKETIDLIPKEKEKEKENWKSELEALKLSLPLLIQKFAPRSVKSGGGGGSTMRVDNLSSQANGSTRTFTTTYRIGTAHALFYSSFPSVFVPTTDYTANNMLITLNSAINPPVAGQSLIFFYEDAS